MKPRLIVLNGPLGSGKSTLAERYANDHPATLILDIDNVWSMISHWRDQKEITAPLSKKIALAMASVALIDGRNVIVPQILQTEELANSFQKLAAQCGAAYFEVLLEVPKDESIKRFTERSKSQGHPTGFREGGIIATSGREEKLAEMHDNMVKVANSRPHTIKVEPVLDDIEGTYTTLLSKIDGKLQPSN
jgi:adenylate kinase family enzyme